MGIIYKNGIAYGNQPSIDATLTHQGEAADAKAVGDAVGELRNTLNHKADVIYDTASGAIASFPDGADGLPVKDLTVAIEPVQDLHGYDNPWPAGGGKNLLDESQIAQNKFVNKNNGAIGNSDDSDASDYIKIEPNTTYYFGETGITGIAEWAAYYDANKDYVSGAVLSVNSAFTTPADVAYLRTSLHKTRTNTYVNYPSTVTTYSPYSNICPISGWTGANVSRTGINVWDEEWEVGGWNTGNGDKYNSNNQIRNKNIIPVLPNTTYYIHAENTYILYYDANKAFISYHGSSIAYNTFTTPSNCYYINFCEHSNYGTTYNHDISINYPSTDHDYHSGANNTTIPISWQSEAGTVYGGTLDVTSGVLTVTMASVNLSSLSWTRNTNYTVPFFWAFLSNSAPNSDYGRYGVCSCYNCTTCTSTTKPWSQTPLPSGSLIYALVGYAGDPAVYIRDDNCSDVTELQSVIANQTLVYELATPQTYQLTPTEVTTLLGQNNIWADTGDSSVEYPADTKLYIDKKLAALVAALS